MDPLDRFGRFFLAGWLALMTLVIVGALLSGCTTQSPDGISQREALAITQILRKDLSNDR